MLDLRSAASDHDPHSLSHRLRARRFGVFERLAVTLPRPLRILDVGGTTAFWEQRGWAGRDDVVVIVLNLTAAERAHDNVIPVVGDATDLSAYADNSVDVVFSNSVIEHLFTLEAQAAMAREVRRVGTAYWVQTPNFWFPMEPHFHVPGWQWFPRTVRVGVLRRRRCGWRGPCPEVRAAQAAIDEVRLLTAAELRRLFPGGALYAERFAGLVKSWVVYDGFDGDVHGFV